MDQFGMSIVAGVIAGLVTSLALFLFACLWRDRLLPSLEDRIYRGIRVDGTWSLTDKLDEDNASLYSQEETLELVQKATHLTGRLILTPKKGENLKPRTLMVEGTIRDRFVMINCTPSTRRHLGYQTLLGEISGDGNTITAKAAYYHIEDGKIEAVEGTYERQTGA